MWQIHDIGAYSTGHADGYTQGAREAGHAWDKVGKLGRDLSEVSKDLSEVSKESADRMHARDLGFAGREAWRAMYLALARDYQILAQRVDPERGESKARAVLQHLDRLGEGVYLACMRAMAWQIPGRRTAGPEIAPAGGWRRPLAWIIDHTRRPDRAPLPEEEHFAKVDLRIETLVRAADAEYARREQTARGE